MALNVYDLAGNVWEWCNDWHTCNLGTVAESDPPGPGSGLYRVLRGGSWNYYEGSLRSAYRYYSSPYYTNNYYGVRVARSQ